MLIPALFLAGMFILHVARYQTIYRLNADMSDLPHFVALLVVTIISAGLVFAFMVFEKPTKNTRAIFATVVLSVTVDLLRNTYPGSGCATYLTSLLFFVTSSDVRMKPLYLYGSMFILLISLGGFAMGLRR
jgi:hypothetical protein